MVSRILEGIKDRATAGMAAEVVRADPYHAAWYEPYVESRPLPQPIADAFEQLRSQQATSAEDEIPF